jgi:hypothetical protein
MLGIGVKWSLSMRHFHVSDLGTLPLAFCTSYVFSTVFFGFLGLVTLLGCGHGLILMPVILSTIGPEDHVDEVTSEPDRVRSDLKHEAEERTKIMENDDPPVLLTSSLSISL